VLVRLLPKRVFVEIVPGAWPDEKKTSSTVLPEKKFSTMTLFWAPRVASVAPPKPVSASPDLPLSLNVLPIISEFWIPP
jgi:hypothetical protein